MPDASVKMGVTGIAQFKSGMNQAQQSVKTLDAALKLNEKQLQATGDKETYMQQKSKLLQQQIAAQNIVIKQGQQALAAMEKNGVNPASQAYQKMQQQVLNAQTALLGMNDDLNTVGESAQETAQKTDQLASSLNGINKKVNFDAVLSGIGKITDGMEAAGHKIEAIARDVWDTMATAAAWADNENTLAAMYGIDVETLQRMQGASRTIDTSVDVIIKAQQKLKNGMVYGSDDIQTAFKTLGVSLGYFTGKGGEVHVFRDAMDVFWEAGEALKNYGDEVERDAMAQKIFGNSWQQLMPLFQAGRETYEKTLGEQSVVTQENVDKLNALDDALQGLDQEFQTLKTTVLSSLAPAFTELADGFSGLLKQFNEYIQTDEGKEKLEALSSAVTELFTGITDVDFSTALDTAGGILDTITGALGWIKDNKDGVVDAIQGIGTAFLLLKAAQVVGGLVQGAAALKSLLGSGGAAGAAGAAAGGAASGAAAGAAVGASTGSSLLDALGIGALLKTAAEASHELGTGLVGALTGANKKVMVGVYDPTASPSGTPKRSRKVSGTATEDQMQGRIPERTAEMIYDDLYKAINDYDPETNALNTNQMFENILEPLVREATTQGGVVGDAADSIADLFYDKWIQSLFDDEWEGTTGGLLNILQEAIDENADGLKVETAPVLPEDAASSLQQQLDGVTLSVNVVPDLSSIDGTHANGLPFVPFDGYIAALHKGERIVPAAQNKTMTNNSNLYVEHMHMNNGTDVNGLASAIAERTRRTMAGLGS